MMNNDSVSKALHKSLRLIHIRFRSKYEIKTRLLSSGFQIDEIDEVIQKLESKDLLNDERFLRSFIRYKTEYKFMGVHAIKSELLPFNIDKMLVDRCIEEIFTSEYEMNIIEKLLEKKRITQNQILSEKEYQKLLNLLQRKGHSWQNIRSVLESLSIQRQ